ncbi:kinase-like protein [Pilatotrama ljubarskyi]|nr:kinase-like protein [Pilatotrama ljubarskyi]
MPSVAPSSAVPVSGHNDKLEVPSASCTTSPVQLSVPITVALANSEAKKQPTRVLKTDDFRIIRILGEGGQGMVSLVEDLVTRKLYALKAISKHMVLTQDLPTVFVEQDVMKTLSGNPFFTSLKGSFEDEDHFFLLTDYCSGGDLNDKIRQQGRLSTDEARLFAAQIVLGMEELRRQRIIHRDIKPKNILINAQNEVIISDFGLSRMFGRTVDEQPWRLRKIWQTKEDRPEYVPEAGFATDKTKAACGTFAYIAPELYTGEHSYEADVWSFAVMLYEMLHGKLPFGFEGNVPSKEFISRVVSEEVEVGQEVDADASDLLIAMLAKDPLRRPTWEQIKAHPWFDSM